MRKQEVINELRQHGIKAVFSQEGVPTVFTQEPSNIRNIVEKLKEIFRQCGYDQSFSVKCGAVKEERPDADEVAESA